MSFGFILSKMVSNIDQPLGVADEADLQRVLQHMGEVDWLEYVRQQKPNSKWQITLLTKVWKEGQVAQVVDGESRSGYTGKRQAV